MSPLSISSSAIVNRGKRQTQAVVEWQRTNSRDGFLRRSSGLIGKQQVRIRGTIPAQRNDIQQPQQPNQGKISILQQKQQPPPPVFQESYQALPIAADQCCSCGSGRPGPPGFPGTDGYPGI